MGRPSEQQFASALEEAQRLRTEKVDPGYLGHCYLSLSRRVKALEEVLDKTRHFLHSGYGGTEHAALLKAIENADHEYLEGADDEDVHPW